MARLDTLPAPARRLAQIAAVQGRQVSTPLLQPLWEGPEELEDTLGVLTRHEFLYAQEAPTIATYIFKHALTQEAVYQSLPLTRRQTLHAVLGRTLEALYADHPDAGLSQIAYHYGCSNEAQKAISYLRQFGAKAARSFAHVEAIAAYQQALQHVETLPPAQQDRVRLTLLLDQAFSLAGLFRLQDIFPLLLPQQTRLEQLQDATLMGPYYFRLGLTATYLGAYDQSFDYARRALAAAQRCNDTLTVGLAYYLQGVTHTWSGQFLQGLEASRQAVTYLLRTDDQYWLGMAYWNVGANAAFLGEFATALAALEHTAALGTARDDRRLQHMASIYQAWVYVMQGQGTVGIAMYQNLLAHNPDPSMAFTVRLYLGLAYVEQGNTAQAIPLLEQVIQRAREQHFPFAESRAAALLGEALLREGRLQQAQHTAQHAQQVGQGIACTYLMACAQRVLGRLAQSTGDAVMAEKHFQQALSIFTTLQTQYEITCTRLLLAELAQTTGSVRSLHKASDSG
jgi:tetratricopeptide (TPR) repeat protein